MQSELCILYNPRYSGCLFVAMYVHAAIASLATASSHSRVGHALSTFPIGCMEWGLVH